MFYRFNVILTPECNDIDVYVLGSCPEMGHWDPNKAVLMKPTQAVLSMHEPCLWIGDVQLAEPCKDSLWFKFIKRIAGNFIWEGITHLVKLLQFNITHRPNETPSTLLKTLK